MIDNIPEYREMRKGLMAIRLEVAASIADDLTSRCERAVLAVHDAAVKDGFEAGYAAALKAPEPQP